jgi:hypothetical protein
MNPEKRLSNEEIKARLILIVGVALSFSFVAAIVSLIYGLLFVVQPLDQSPNDAEAWAVLSPILLTLAGGLIGLLAGNGLKDKPKDPPSAP